MKNDYKADSIGELFELVQNGSDREKIIQSIESIQVNQSVHLQDLTNAFDEFKTFVDAVEKGSSKQIDEHLAKQVEKVNHYLSWQASQKDNVNVQREVIEENAVNMIGDLLIFTHQLKLMMKSLVMKNSELNRRIRPKLLEGFNDVIREAVDHLLDKISNDDANAVEKSQEIIDKMSTLLTEIHCHPSPHRIETSDLEYGADHQIELEYSDEVERFHATLTIMDPEKRNALLDNVENPWMTEEFRHHLIHLCQKYIQKKSQDTAVGKWQLKPFAWLKETLTTTIDADDLNEDLDVQLMLDQIRRHSNCVRM